MTPDADRRTITDLAPLIRRGEISPVEIVQGALARIAARAELNAFITVLADSAIADAQAAERDIAAGRYRGPLHGLPISVKDLVDVAGTPTTSGSRVPPRQATADAPVVSRLREAGAIVIGKTNLHEFAFGTTSEESAFGPVRHPLDPSRAAGGSSGGAAVALVEGMAVGSVGTDTGGSIRIPAAVCGTVGLKPTLGEISCDGVVPLSATMDHVGPLARSVADAALLYRAMAGEDLRADGGAAPRDARLRFGVPQAYFCDRLAPEVRAAFERTREHLAASGHDVAVVDVAGAECTADVYLHIVLPEAAWYHAPMLAAHARDYSPGVRLRIEMGRYILAEDMVRALGLRERLTRAVDAAMDGCDALLLPTLPIVAPPIGAPAVDVGGEPLPVRAAMLRLTQLFNMTGHPAIALPNTPAGGGWPTSVQGVFPTSVQLVGRRGDTRRLLDVASVVERVIASDRAGDRVEARPSGPVGSR